MGYHPVSSPFKHSYNFQIQIQNLRFVPIAFHPIRLSLSFQPVGIFSDPDSITDSPFNCGKRTWKFSFEDCFSKDSLSNFWELPISPCSVIGSTSPSLRWLYRFCNLSQRLADSRAQLGVPNYQKPDLNDNVCRRAKHAPARGLTAHPVQGQGAQWGQDVWVARMK